MKKLNRSFLAMGIITFFTLSCSSAKVNSSILALDENKVSLEDVMKDPLNHPEQLVTYKNWLIPPYNKWGLVNSSAFKKTTLVPRASRHSYIYQINRSSLGKLPITVGDQKFSLIEALKMINVDGIIIAMNNAILYEKYLNPFMHNYSLHPWFSMSESLIFALAGIAVDEGKLDLSKTIKDYLPNLPKNNFDKIPIKEFLTMSSGLDDKEFFEYVKDFFKEKDSFSFITYYNTYNRLFEINMKNKNNIKFNYNLANIEIIGFLISYLYDKSLEKILYEKIWSKMGSEQEGMFFSDDFGNGIASIGFQSSLRDLTRFGIMLDNKGRYNGSQIIPKEFIEESLNPSGKDKKLYTKDIPLGGEEFLAYKNGLWILDDTKKIFLLKSQNNQIVYVNMERHIVISLFSSVDWNDKDSTNPLLYNILDSIAYAISIH